ncbi:MAG: electron transfer flavoprotein subunit alpha [Verrucomicrobia bacterium]|nr:electron transfer flavoprotein subunit alpha [Verrucomicrobiota bacterium]
MSIIVYVSTKGGDVLKSSLEAVSYAAQTAETSNQEVVAISVGKVNSMDELGKYGANRLIQVQSSSISSFQPNLIAKAIHEIVKMEGSNLCILSHDLNGKAIAPILSVEMNAGMVTGAVGLPDNSDGFMVRKGVFSGKAFANIKILSENKIVTVMPNSIEKKEFKNTTNVEDVDIELGTPRITVIDQKIASTDVPLPEAEKVVSAGRGLKGPENWQMVEDLAKELGAATACSRPVADMDWRPHHEHVGQTGVAIRPNLYIAIGISGAIQHLAGVNQSKVIVVINTDKEAPFFKSADYGIVGDAFEVVPKLVEAVKRLNA